MTATIKNINVIGLGYIGLPTAATLANAGFDVLGIEVRASVVDKINSGDIHIQEPGLDILVRAAFQRGALRASLEPRPADAHIIAVPTPINPDKSPDLSYVEAATRTIAGVIRPGDLVVLESTVPPRTCECVVAPIIRELAHLEAGRDYDLAHCPERVIPGQILHEIIHNDRIIGGMTPDATRRTAALYGSFVKGALLETDATTAEMCKLMENTFRDVNIALANELATIADDLGIEVDQAIKLANHHPRVNIHHPGIGVGGHCIPVDPWFIIHSSPANANLMRTARAINDARPHALADRIRTIVQSDAHAVVAFFGLSYKADVDDIRESPAMEVVRLVAEWMMSPSMCGSTIRLLVVEPHLDTLPVGLADYSCIKQVGIEEALARANVIVGLVGHSGFKHIDLMRLQNKTVIDPVRIWPKTVQTHRSFGANEPMKSAIASGYAVVSVDIQSADTTSR
jgi:UDP-N-acetyl-D-mannosaminuronic acid dehydrogenase